MEDFVTFEMAKKLKEKGFREECSTRYYCSDEAYFERNAYDPDTESVFYCYNNDEDLCRWYIDAPTISQVLKWLREEKGIYITIFIDDDSDTPVTYEIYKDIECVCTHQGEYFTLKDWNECELRAIEYTLDNLI